MRRGILVGVWAVWALGAWGQRGLGVRFASQFTQISRPEAVGLVGGYFSAFAVGPVYVDYRQNGGGEVGLNVIVKDLAEGFNLPVVMRDFDGGQNTALTALELEARVGPRFGWLYPQLGGQLGYRLRSEGFFVAGAPSGSRVNRLYLNLPLGVALHLPTSFGTVGASVHYTVGLSNWARNPDGRTGWQGGTALGWRVGLHLVFGEPTPGGG